MALASIPETVTMPAKVTLSVALIPVSLTRTTTGAKGRKAHPMDRFAPPDDPAEVEILTVKDERGVEIEITDAELRRAEDALLKAVIEARDDYEADRADSIRSRYRDDLAR